LAANPGGDRVLTLWIGDMTLADFLVTRTVELVCPACGSPVDTVLRRRKSLGIFIPEWVPGPCRNPECPRCTSPAGQGG
ncbi:hypothetical protein ACWD3L_31405, partial [Streptomyces sp. NPDC002587]